MVLLTGLIFMECCTNNLRLFVCNIMYTGGTQEANNCGLGDATIKGYWANQDDTPSYYSEVNVSLCVCSSYLPYPHERTVHIGTD